MYTTWDSMLVGSIDIKRFVSISVSMNTNNKINGVWADEKTAAEYYKIKPATLRKHRSEFGHDKGLEWK